MQRFTGRIGVFEHRYGLFWWSLVLIWLNPFAQAGIEPARKVAMGQILNAEYGKTVMPLG